MNEIFVEELQTCWKINPAQFPPSISSLEDVEIYYDVFRSLRRGSDSRTSDEGVLATDVEIVNRWVKEKSSGSNRGVSSMRAYYADMGLITKPFLRYTQAM